MSFQDAETSVQGASIVEVYDFVAPWKTWHLTSHESDVTYNGVVYTAVSGSRSGIAVQTFGGDQGDVTVQVPASHDLAQTYVGGVPPRDLLVTITRYYPMFAGTPSLQFWQGYASAIQMANRMASFRIPDGLNDALATDVPSVSAQRICNHVLYDGRCTINRGAGYTVNASIASISVDGKTIGSSGAVPGAVLGVPWSYTGELLHVASGERRTIIVENSTTSFTLQAPFPNSLVHVGDAIQIFAGCTRAMDQCSSSKFNNGINFGGFPYLPSSNIFYVGLLGARYSY